jgi:hypothetical protein
LARKEELLNDTKLKIANFEHSLKDLDQQIQVRSEKNLNGYNYSDSGLAGTHNATNPLIPNFI